MYKTKAIIFDMDGTLVDTEIIWYLAWKEANEHFGLGLSDETMKTFIGLPKQKFDENRANIFKENTDFDEISKYRVAFYKEYVKNHGLDAKPYALETLKKVRRLGLKAIVCTATFEKQAYKSLEDAGLAQYIDMLVSGERIVRSKPEPDTYYLALGQSGLNREEVIAVEDSKYGLIAATRAKIKTYMVPDIIPPDEECHDMAFKILETLYEFIKEMENGQAFND